MTDEQSKEPDELEPDDHPIDPPARVEEERPRPAFEAMMGMVQQFGPAPPPVVDKIESEHITGLIDIQRLTVEGSFEDRKLQRRSNERLVIIGSILVVVLISLLLFTGNPDQVDRLVVLLVAIVGSAFGGYGLRSSRDG